MCLPVKATNGERCNAKSTNRPIPLSKPRLPLFFSPFFSFRLQIIQKRDFHGFWRWVIIAGALAGLIVLCCVGWYIRNPFFCQKEPPTGMLRCNERSSSMHRYICDKRPSSFSSPSFKRNSRVCVFCSHDLLDRKLEVRFLVPVV